MITHPWPGSWVAERLDIGLRTTGSAVGLEAADLIGLAVRRNARRAHLLVSRVLGKHVPTDPWVVYGAGRLLGALAADALDDHRVDRSAAGAALRSALAGTAGAPEPVPVAASKADALVLGYAETATALGHCVADGLGGADYLHSTRRQVPGISPSGGFEEEHSHATSHLMLPSDPAIVTRSRPLVLVDDELSTGRTVLNTIRGLHRSAPRDHYVVATLVDARPAADRASLAAAVAELDARIDVVSLVDCALELPDGLVERGADLVTTLPEPATVTGAPAGSLRSVVPDWPRDLPVGGRHGFSPAHRAALEQQLPGLAADVLLEAVPDVGSRVLVLGFEELMYLPLRLATELARTRTDLTVTSSATTRSPVLAVPDEGYPIRHAIRFPAHDGFPGEDRFVYNVGAVAEPWDLIVLVVDEVGDTAALRAPGGLLESLRPHAREVLLVTMPAGDPR